MIWCVLRIQSFLLFSNNVMEWSGLVLEINASLEKVLGGGLDNIGLEIGLGLSPVSLGSLGYYAVGCIVFLALLGKETRWLDRDKG